MHINDLCFYVNCICLCGWLQSLITVTRHSMNNIKY